MAAHEMTTRGRAPTQENIGLGTTANRYAPTIKWTPLALIVIALIVVVRALPVSPGVDRLKAWVDGLGALGIAVFGAAYVAPALLFVPGAMAAGALFGLWTGTVVVSVASTTAACLAFLIARHLARAKVAEQAGRFPRFCAIDRGDRSWRRKDRRAAAAVPRDPFQFGVGTRQTSKQPAK